MNYDTLPQTTRNLQGTDFEILNAEAVKFLRELQARLDPVRLALLNCWSKSLQAFWRKRGRIVADAHAVATFPRITELLTGGGFEEFSGHCSLF